MKVEDVNRLKGSVKSAVQDWVNAKIEEVVPNKAAMRYVAKNYVNNVLNRMDSKLNVRIENIYLAVADEKGVIWVYGLGVSERIAVTKNTKKLLEVEVQEL